ncbi:MAG: uroporphyrinogen decarboxylase family protein [Candidatus Thermoplasmatota archaeon]|nr:uroporphyrinogen decarboxylase family protein [Candidatus Thermoplasmatota archaeon]
MEKIKTSVVGSYPVKIDTMDIMMNYFNQKENKTWNKYIKNAVDDMNRAGIDILSDGQTRDPFIQLFARRLKGCRIRDRVEVIDKIQYDGPITVDDQKYVRTIIPKNRMLKGVITGPFTLSKSCINIHYKDEKTMAFDFAYALKQEAEKLEKHVDMISIDEPFFSNEMPDYGKELIGVITEKIRCPTILHACGDVSEVIPDLLDMPVDILSHEFKASPHLLNEFREYSFSKKLCLGSVRSDNQMVESVEEIVKHIRKAVDIFGEKIVQVSPDCGQRLLPRESAYEKLRNLVKAGEIINGG